MLWRMSRGSSSGWKLLFATSFVVTLGGGWFSSLGYGVLCGVWPSRWGALGEIRGELLATRVVI